MTEERRRSLPARVAPVLLLAALAVAAWLVPGDGATGLSLANPDRARAQEAHDLAGNLPQGALVLVGMDPDLGTYPEIRPAVRALFDELLSRDAGLAFVSFSPEGRAIAAAEMDRLRAGGATDGSLLDLGFVAGAEAGLVRAVTSVVPAGAGGGLADAVRNEGGGMAAFEAAVVVGGIDFGPRSWVEQVGPRLPQLPMLAIAPSVSQPELAPYLRSGQLHALLATIRDDAAYVALSTGEIPGEPGSGSTLPSAMAMLVGMVVALAAIGWALLPRGVGRGDALDNGSEPVA